MADIREVEPLAMELEVKQRAILAAHLLESLPSVLHDEDEGIAEALRRDAEMDQDSGKSVSIEDLDRMVKERRGKD